LAGIGKGVDGGAWEVIAGRKLINGVSDAMKG